MKTIALVHYRLILRGGVETRFINYAHYLAKQGYEVTMICAKKSDDIELPKSVKVVVLNLGLVPKVFRMLYFNFKLKKYFEKNNFDFSLALQRTYSQDAALAPSNHLGFLKAMNKKGNRLTDKVQTYLDRKTYQHSKVIFACSQMIKDELVELFKIDANKIEVLFPPTNVQDFKRPTLAEKKVLKLKLGMSPHKKTFAFVSASHKRKGLPLLLKLFKQLDSDEFELFIAGYPKIKTGLDNVHFLGFLEEPRDLYAAADFTIHPALYEPYGQIITESIQCGTPVIVSNKVGAKEIINAKNGVVLHDFKLKTWLDCIQNLTLTDFDIPLDYIKQQQLDLANHVEKILETSSQIKSK